MRTHIKRVRTAVDQADQGAAKTALEQAVPVLDKCAQKGVIPRQRASRLVSRLTLAVQKLAAQ